MQERVNNFSLSEEIWHAVTHGLGFVLSIVALTLLVATAYKEGNSINIVAATIYGTSLIIMYGSSTLYHAITHIEIKRLFQKFDHSAIYFLIAGTYTPVALIGVGGVTGWSIFGVEWFIAIIGVALKFLYPNRFEMLSLIAYLFMGWLIVLAIGTLKANIYPTGFWLIVAGGMAYSGGIIFYIKDDINYWHTLWHIFVLLGSILQFFAIVLYII